jgi:sugar phosphate isomerase/epimerase
MNNIANRLYISTISDDAADLARKYGLGLEIAEFCTAFNMDKDFEKWDALVRSKIRGVKRLMFHAPFNELCPAAIDPMIAEVAKKRYAQAYSLMKSYGINTMIAHSGFMPVLYEEEWFMAHSIDFWKGFLSDKPDEFRLYIENVFEPSPKMLCGIVDAVNDKRLGLCLDVGHAAISGHSVPIAEWVKQFLPFLRHVHLHNNYGKYDSHNALGDGVVDVANLIRKVMGAAPDVTFSIETSDCKTSAKWMKSYGFLVVCKELEDDN